jgi:hypothetical protein
MLFDRTLQVLEDPLEVKIPPDCAPFLWTASQDGFSFTPGFTPNRLIIAHAGGR